MTTGGGYESHIDRQIREAQERGDFDDLPGLGKPLPDRGELHDEEWWLKDLMRRENITGVLPTTLALRKQSEQLMEVVAGLKSEQAVREHVTRLNEQILKAIRGHVDGPPVVLKPFKVDEIVQAWHDLLHKS